jgi:hypothetical protein
MTTRPLCVQCKRPMHAEYTIEYVRVDTPTGFRTEPRRGELRGHGYAGNDFFCSLRCGYRFGLKHAITEDSTRSDD